MKQNKHIEIVRASPGAHGAMGQRTCEMVKAVLDKHYERVGITVLNNENDLELLDANHPDLVFLGTRKVANSPKLTILTPRYLDDKGINYTGSPASALALDISKPLAKQVVESAGLNTAAYFNVYAGQYDSESELPLPFPLFVKPPIAGGSKGIGADSVVRDFDAFERQVKIIGKRFNSEALAETYLTGREFSVAVLANRDSDELSAMPIELITSQNSRGDRILGEDVKSADTERAVAVSDRTTKQAVSDLALDVFRALGARDFGRIDIRLDETGNPHFMEANLIPGLSGHDSIGGYFTRACQINAYIDYESMILRIVELALSRGSNLIPSIIVRNENIIPAFGPALGSSAIS